MKLQILITQYDETEEILSGMLNTLNNQIGINFEDFEVLIGNDGSDIKLSEDFLNSFKYNVKYYLFEHFGVSGCRKNLFDVSTADYVMFCDADDIFFSNLGLHTIFAYIERGFDAFASEFYEELRPEGKTVIIPRKHDCIFVHGKVYRRQYLLDQKIVWHLELKRHEDSCFTILAQKLAKNFVYCDVPFYMWRWRDDSVCRRSKFYIPETYQYMIDSNECLVANFLAHKDLRNATIYANSMVYTAYYIFNNPIWLEPEGEKYKYITEKRFKEYYNKHKILIDAITPLDKQRVIQSMARQAERDGTILVRFTFDDWMKHIQELQ